MKIVVQLGNQFFFYLTLLNDMTGPDLLVNIFFHFFSFTSTSDMNDKESSNING